jgi:hypothetical protein
MCVGIPIPGGGLDLATAPGRSILVLVMAVGIAVAGGGQRLIKVTITDITTDIAMARMPAIGRVITRGNIIPRDKIFTATTGIRRA